MNKAELRRDYLVKRKAFASSEIEHCSQLITRLFFDLLEKQTLAVKPGILHTFLPIQHKNEVDTWPLIRHLWVNFRHIQVAASVTDIQQNTLSHYIISPETLLTTTRWGIPEPVTTTLQSCKSTDFSIVLVPLLIFDHKGNRVGYGGGYYDRFLADCQPNCLKVGVSLFESVGEIDDVEQTDIPLDICITPAQVYFFN